MKHTMSGRAGTCIYCGAKADETCMLCGALVCKLHLDEASGACINCLRGKK